ncbi:histidine kinase [Streptomyces sp. NPDC006798]|uniref:sensor histidine kinase n=1 Tax=Streptomyces sp. NPDC006798 TaxID=3155462 RepID=UPI0033F417BF
MIPRTALEALTRRPLRFLLTSWPWRSAGYLLGGGLLGVGGWVAVGGLLAARSRLGPGVAVGGSVAVLAFVVAVAGPLERRRLRLVDRDAAREPVGRPSADRGRTGWRDTGYGALSVLAAGWADLALLIVAGGVPAFLLTAPLQPSAPLWARIAGPVAGVFVVPVAAYPVTAWAGARAMVARAVLLPREGELREVRRSRARLMDAYESERRRIERDLHDGAQQRLVALSVKLGLAGLDLPPGSRAAREVAEAHRMAKDALAELRELIRGVHPQVLSERGLAAAVRDVAGRSPLPVDLELRLAGRLPSSVEVAAYYAVSEALTNAARHSGAARCRVGGALTGGTLVVEVSDDGRGGADPGGGTGLTGLADRVAAVDGRMLLSSPPGGPTRLRVEIPVEGAVDGFQDAGAGVGAAGAVSAGRGVGG